MLQLRTTLIQDYCSPRPPGGALYLTNLPPVLRAVRYARAAAAGKSVDLQIRALPLSKKSDQNKMHENTENCQRYENLSKWHVTHYSMKNYGWIKLTRLYVQHTKMSTDA